MFTLSLYERDGSPFWWVKCYLEGEGGAPRRWSSKVRIDSEGGRRGSRRLATERAEERARRLTAAIPGSRDEAALIEVAKRMLRQKTADGRRPRAVDALAHSLKKHVQPFFGPSRDVRTIRRLDLEAFKAHLTGQGGGRKYSAVTVNNCLVAIRQVLKHAANVDELLETVPHVANVFVSSEGKGRALSIDEVLSLLSNLDPRAVEARDFLAFIANTAMRKTETLAMRWGWIDWDRKRLVIPGEFRKGGKGKWVPLNATALEILERRKTHGTKYTGTKKVPLYTGPGDRVWIQGKHDAARNSAAKKAGLGRVRTHDLRHTRGSLLWAAGATLPEVRDILGHKGLAMVSRYAHAYDDRLQEAAESVQVVPDEKKRGAKKSG